MYSFNFFSFAEQFLHIYPSFNLFMFSPCFTRFARSFLLVLVCFFTSSSSVSLPLMSLMVAKVLVLILRRLSEHDRHFIVHKGYLWTSDDLHISIFVDGSNSIWTFGISELESGSSQILALLFIFAQASPTRLHMHPPSLPPAIYDVTRPMPLNGHVFLTTNIKQMRWNLRMMVFQWDKQSKQRRDDDERHDFQTKLQAERSAAQSWENSWRHQESRWNLGKTSLDVLLIFIQKAF